MNAALITVKIKKFINKFIVRFYKYIIVFSYLFKIPFLKFYLVRNIYIIDKSKENIWYLDYKRSTQEIDFLKTNKFNLLLTNILFIKELILFLDEKKKFHEYKKKFVFNLLNEIGIKLIISPAIVEAESSGSLKLNFLFKSLNVTLPLAKTFPFLSEIRLEEGKSCSSSICPTISSKISSSVTKP